MPSEPTLSAHASRNPLKPVQPSRQRQKQSDATKASRALAAELRRDREAAFEARVDEFFQLRADTIEELATEFGKTKDLVTKILVNGKGYGGKRSVNLKNAIAHDLTLQANEAGEDGDLFISKLSGEEYKIYKESLSSTEKTRILKQLSEKRDIRTHGARATNKAVANDVIQTSTLIGKMLVELYERTGTRSAAFFTRAHPNDPAIPCMVDCEATRNFFLDVLKIDHLDVVRKLELWACTRDQEGDDSIQTVQRKLTELVAEGLRKLKNKKIDMKWENYDVEIVSRYGVELANWPKNALPMRRPSKLPASEVRSIVTKLESGEIHWVALSTRQREERAARLEEEGEGGKKRRERSDKGKKRGPRRKKATESDDEQDD
ncbi:hypothetical protein R3P38DRAFT_2374949, partial [Favolaschia claudopus]